jgi:hypothetical protein
MSTINDLPNELLLEVFPHLPLKSLISSQGVCRRWRHLVPISDISSIRRDLLELYVEITSSPFFERTRPWTLANLRPFDRNEYLDELLKQHDYIPEAFCIWILEWPARAVIGNAWPALPCKKCTEDMADGAERREGVNWLGHTPPVVSAMEYENSDSEEDESTDSEEDESTDSEEDESSVERDVLPSLLIWSGGNCHTWLMLDQRRSVRDKVYRLGRWISAIHGEDGNKGIGDVYADWIQWQRSLWRGIERAAEKLSDERGG